MTFSHELRGSHSFVEQSNGIDRVSPTLQDPDITTVSERISEFVKNSMQLFFAIPDLSFVLGVLGYAVAGGVVLSLHETDMFFNKTFVGLKNYNCASV